MYSALTHPCQNLQKANLSINHQLNVRTIHVCGIYTVQHRTDLTIFPLVLQIDIITAQIFST